jgi:hypothetical protein
MVSNIYTIIMMTKLKYELGIGNLKLLKRRRRCGGISKLLVLLVLTLFFCLIMSCFIPNKEIFSSP